VLLRSSSRSLWGRRRSGDVGRWRAPTEVEGGGESACTGRHGRRLGLGVGVMRRGDEGNAFHRICWRRKVRAVAVDGGLGIDRREQQSGGGGSESGARRKQNGGGLLLPTHARRISLQAHMGRWLTAV
jgi:hypothetical protein